jgi:hypothetical protein
MPCSPNACVPNHVHSPMPIVRTWPN